MSRRSEQTPLWRRRLRRFFARPGVEICVAALILVSVSLTLVEFWMDHHLRIGSTGNVGIPGAIFGVPTLRKLLLIELVGDIITGIFVIELSLRYAAIGSWKRFISEYWLDVLATIPVFRIFRTARALRLLRLIRLFRLMGVLSRLSSHFPYILRRGAVDFLVICGLLTVSVAFGTIAMMRSEKVDQAANDGSVAKVAATPESAASSETHDGSDDEANFDLENSFWFSVYTLFAGEPIPATPQSLSGRIIAVFLMFMGMTIFAIFAGTVSAFMVDRLRVEGKVVDLNELDDHVIICGWTAKTEIIIREYRATKLTRTTPIVVISELDSDQLGETVNRLPNVWLVNDDFTKLTALKRAGIERAKTCLVLSDTTCGRSEQDADARTILAALTAEKINPDVYTCAELVNREYASHLDTGHVNDYVVSGEYGAHMLAQASKNRGLVDVLGELLTSKHGNEFHRRPIPKSWIGRPFNELYSEVKNEKDVVLLAVHRHGDPRPQVNPTDYVFEQGDEVVLITHGAVEL